MKEQTWTNRLNSKSDRGLPESTQKEANPPTAYRYATVIYQSPDTKQVDPVQRTINRGNKNTKTSSWIIARILGRKGISGSMKLKA